MKRRRVVLVSALVIGALAVMLIVVLPAVLPVLVARQLEQIGWQVEELSVASLGWGGLQSGPLAITGPGGRWRASAASVQIGWQVGGLWRGRVSDVHFADARLELAAADPVAAGETTDWPDLASLTDAVLPFARLRVEPVEIVYPDAPVVTGRLGIDADGAAWHARVVLTTSTFGERKLSVRAEPPGTLTLALAPEEAAGEPPLRAQLRNAGEGLEARLLVDLAALRRTLPIAVREALPAAAGGVDATIALARPQPLALPYRVTLHSDGIRFAMERVTTGPVDATLRGTVERSPASTTLRVEADSVWSVAALDAPAQGVRIARVDTTFGGTLAPTPDGVAAQLEWDMTLSGLASAVLAAERARWTSPATQIDSDGPVAHVVSDSRLQLEDLTATAYRADAAEFVWRAAFRAGPDERTLTTEQGRLVVSGAVDGERRIGRIATDVGLDIDFGTDGDGRTAIALPGPVELTGLALNGTELDAVRLTPTGPAVPVVRFDAGALRSVDALSWTLELPSLGFAGARVKAAPLTVTADYTAAPAALWRIAAAAPTATVDNELTTLTLRDLTAAAQLSADGASGTFATASHERRLRWRGRWQHDLTRGSGRATFASAALDLGAAGTTLASLVGPQPLPLPMDLVAGEVRLSGEVGWRPQTPVALDARLRLSNAGGYVDRLVFSGLDVDLPMGFLPTLRSRGSAPVQIDDIDFGVVLSDIRADLSFATPRSGAMPVLRLGDVSAGVVGGTLASERIVYDPNRESNNITIALNRLDIASIVDLHGFADLQASGRLDGTLQVTIDRDGVSIDAGTMRAVESGGEIRYTGSIDALGIGAQSEQLRLVQAALENFRYDRFEATIRYRPDGRLILGLQLGGRSAALGADRPVNLNVNLEQNLLALLESLRYTEGLDAAIEKRVRDRYKALPDTP